VGDKQRDKNRKGKEKITKKEKIEQMGLKDAKRNAGVLAGGSTRRVFEIFLAGETRNDRRRKERQKKQGGKDQTTKGANEKGRGLTETCPRQRVLLGGGLNIHRMESWGEEARKKENLET